MLITIGMLQTNALIASIAKYHFLVSLFSLEKVMSIAPFNALETIQMIPKNTKTSVMAPNWKTSNDLIL